MEGKLFDFGEELPAEIVESFVNLPALVSAGEVVIHEVEDEVVEEVKVEKKEKVVAKEPEVEKVEEEEVKEVIEGLKKVAAKKTTAVKVVVKK